MNKIYNIHKSNPESDNNTTELYNEIIKDIRKWSLRLLVFVEKKGKMVTWPDIKVVHKDHVTRSYKLLIKQLVHSDIRLQEQHQYFVATSTFNLTQNHQKILNPLTLQTMTNLPRYCLIR